MSALTKADLQKVLMLYGFNRTESKLFVNDFFDIIAEAFVNHQAVRLSGFGVFGVLTKKQRMGRNPRSGEEFVISARKTVSFKPSVVFKNRLNERSIDDH